MGAARDASAAGRPDRPEGGWGVVCRIASVGPWLDLPGGDAKCSMYIHDNSSNPRERKSPTSRNTARNLWSGSCGPVVDLFVDPSVHPGVALPNPARQAHADHPIHAGQAPDRAATTHPAAQTPSKGGTLPHGDLHTIPYTTPDPTTQPPLDTPPVRTTRAPPHEADLFTGHTFEVVRRKLLTAAKGVRDPLAVGKVLDDAWLDAGHRLRLNWGGTPAWVFVVRRSAAERQGQNLQVVGPHEP
ncbi:hypothetical protein IW245_000157 [Longispora fulva]|uniref:Uncharacterized protein n=1 Tax=Longispora fulva TaxID=619741 RepID=A0A8J7GLW0_9ACTN|nr:hypothetical protein [Longispora fulva]